MCDNQTFFYIQYKSYSKKSLNSLLPFKKTTKIHLPPNEDWSTGFC